jgi:hypothetical protein
MANPTTNYSFAMPTNTDLVKDLPADFDIFGQAVDTKIKDLNPGTTAGDVDYYTSSTAKARLAIGTAGQVLTVNSGATAPQWSNPSGEKSILVAQQTARYIKYFTGVAINGSFTPTEDRTYYYPIYLPGYALDRISINTSSSHTGTSTIRLGLYNADATTGKPSTVYLDAGTVSATAASTNYEITISNTPPAGYYYFAVNVQAVTGTPALTAFSTGTNEVCNTPFFMPTTSTVVTSTYMTGYTESSITGAFATAGTLAVNTSAIIVIAVRMV